VPRQRGGCALGSNRETCRGC